MYQEAWDGKARVFKPWPTPGRTPISAGRRAEIFPCVVSSRAIFVVDALRFEMLVVQAVPRSFAA
jgi:hypothetical protein